MSQPLLDLTNLEVALGGDREIIGEILDMYVSTAPADVQALVGAVQSGNADATVRSAHALKGSSANVGALRVHAMAADIERRARSGRVDGLPASVEELSRAFEATLEATVPYRGG